MEQRTAQFPKVRLICVKCRRASEITLRPQAEILFSGKGPSNQAARSKPATYVVPCAYQDCRASNRIVLGR